MDNLFILLLALIIDLIFGDPPTSVHPVGWMGKLISLLEKRAPKRSPNARFAFGIVMVLFGVAVFAVPAFFLLEYLGELHRIIYIIVGALLLKSCFSIIGLRRFALRVKNDLNDNNLKSAQIKTSALVSRNTENLTEPLIVAATVESVSESTSDSIVAPLFWFLILGIPGAVAYRVVNTFDSMIGYHGKYEHLGKFAARIDDVLNFIPARLTGLMIVMATFFSRGNTAAAWRIMVRDHSKTESPNAGWPMSAVAGALGVLLEKVGHYKLGETNGALSIQKIDAVLFIMYIVTAIWILLCFTVEGVRFALTS
ncbi:MAG: cobalamin biosynthesis protein [Chloroflexi bacterium]|jgi:adenosylcobinamide-phosphate synthase|nr:cobalamin biosynthesis protein [Chloroflexota bacterium]